MRDIVFDLFSGTFRAITKGASIEDCDYCTAGYYCPTDGMTTPIICDKGRYSDSGATVCIGCDPGRYCNSNATSMAYMNSVLICPAGTECPGNMSVQPNVVDHPCRMGHYCPRGDVNPFPVPCPVGTFNDKYGLQQVSECEACTAGMYCDVEGLTAPVNVCPGGYYCPRGTGDQYTFPCPIGFYRNGSARESFQDCAECTAGYYCDEQGLALPKDCPRGEPLFKSYNVHKDNFVSTVL